MGGIRLLWLSFVSSLALPLWSAGSPLSDSKPLVLLEFGDTSGDPQCDQTRWADAALADLTSLRWPRLIGFSWWNETWQNDNDPQHDTDFRVQDNPALAGIFHKYVGANDQVIGSPLLVIK